MIYQLSQVSNRDTQVLYFYRILRHASTEGFELYRYDSPEMFTLGNANSVEIDGEVFYEYVLESQPKANRVPYLEFQANQESEIKHIEDLVELEVTRTALILRGKTNLLTENTLVSVYWLPSLHYIDELRNRIASLLANLDKRRIDDANAINRLGVSSDFLINLNSRIPDLVAIGRDDEGLIYDDSYYQLSGSVAEQSLLNPTQDTLSGMLKSHIGTLTIKDNTGDSKVLQGFCGGCIKMSGRFKTLVLQSITSVLLLSGITADCVVIDNCPAVMFRESIDVEGTSREIGKLVVRNSYLTINQPLLIDSIWCYRNSTIIQKKGTIDKLGFLEAGSTYVFDKPSAENQVNELRTTAMQGLFYTNQPPVDKPYLDEIFLSQKPISFQRSQVEDPVPISKADVSIYLKKTVGYSSAEPADASKNYTPNTDWYVSGDDRAEGLIAANNLEGISHVGGVYDDIILDINYLFNHSRKNAFLWWGVNDMNDVQQYARAYQDLGNMTSNVVFAGTIGYCPDSTGSGKVDGDHGQDLAEFNRQIETFNRELSNLTIGAKDVYVIDVYQYVRDLVASHGAEWVTHDNYHYTDEAYQMIWDWIINQITHVNPNAFPGAPGYNHPGRIWNWFREAGIPNVSNRPELVAGIIGNLQQESYEAIDILGSGNGFYGPWCESNIDFYNYVTNGGYTFHSYNPSVSLVSFDTVARVLTWLTESSDSWDWFVRSIDKVQNQKGEAGARAYAELFCVCIERCVGGSDSIDDPGVYQVMKDYYGGTVYTYQDLNNRRANAAAIYRTYMNR